MTKSYTHGLTPLEYAEDTEEYKIHLKEALYHLHMVIDEIGDNQTQEDVMKSGPFTTNAWRIMCIAREVAVSATLNPGYPIANYIRTNKFDLLGYKNTYNPQSFDWDDVEEIPF